MIAPEVPGKCVRCSYSQADEVAKQLEKARLLGLEPPPPFLRTMLFVDKHVRDTKGRWGTWQGSKFIRGGGRSGAELYWVCEHCHAPGEAIQLIEKG